MASIDERIVSLKFDNQQFEAGVRQSLASLDALKKGLNVSEAAKGLNDLNTAGRNFSLKGIADGVESIANKFTTLGIVGLAVLANLTNSAINLAKQLVTSVTIDPIMAGFSKYEQKINSLQTILNATSNTVGKVSQATLQGIEAAADAAGQAAIRSSANGVKRLAKAQENASLALNKAIAEETKAFDKAHQDKIAGYNEEYMAKLKVIDEERYNKIKAIDDQIDAIINLSTEEDKAAKKTAEEEILQTLKNNVLKARGIRNRQQAEQALAEYQAQLDKEKLLADRQTIIDGLNANKTSIEEEFDAKAKVINEEFSLKTENESKLYATAAENLSEQQAQRLRNLRDYQRTQSEYAQGSATRALAYIEEQKNAQIAAAQEVAAKINTSMSTDQVNAEIERLNWFADETSYSFTEMLANVSKFTAAGIELKPAVTALQGIATWAALSGVNAQRASGVMYELSQAIGMGVVQIRDWDSVVTAGMGTKEFKENAIETAKSMGLLSKAGTILSGTQKGMMVTSDNFRSTLGSKWFTSDVLMKTVDQYGKYADEVYRVATEQGLSAAEAMKTAEIIALGSTMRLGEKAFKAAQQSKTFTDALNATKDAVSSGWAKSFEILFGNLEEAKVLWTDVASAMWEVFASGKEARNELLQGWKDLGGRDLLISAIGTAYQNLAEIIGVVKEAFSDIFPPMTAKTLLALTEGVKKLADGFKMGVKDSTNLKRTFKGLFSIVDIGAMAFSAIANGIGELIKYLLPVGSSLLEASGSVGDFFVNLRNSIKATNLFGMAVKFVGTVLKPLGKFLKDAVKAMSDFFGSITISLPPFDGFVKSIADLFGSFDGFDTKKAGEVGTKLQEAFSPLEIIGANIKKSFGGLSDSIGEALDKLKTSASTIGTWFSKVSGIITDGGEDFTIENVFGAFSSGALVVLLIGVVKFVRNLIKTFNVGIDFIKGINGVLKETAGALKAWGMNMKADAILKIAIAVGVLALALIALSFVDPVKLVKALGAITVLFIELGILMKVFTKMANSTGFKDMGKVTVGIFLLSLALLALAFAVTKLSKLSLPQMGQGLLGVSALLLGLSLAIKSLTTNKKHTLVSTGDDFMKVAVGIYIFAQAISKLASIVIKLSKLKMEDMLKGLFVLGLLMAELWAFMKFANMSKIDASTGAGFLLIAISIDLITLAVAKLASIDPTKLGIGLRALVAILGGLMIFTKSLGAMKHFDRTAVGILSISAALLILTGVVGMLGNMKVETLGIGIGAIAFLLVELALAVNAMKGAAAGAAVTVAIAAALMLLVPVVLALGTMSSDTLIVGIGAIAALLIVFAGGVWLLSAALGPATPIFAGFFAAMIVGAAAMLVFAFALAIFTPALKALGEIPVNTVINGLGALILVFITLGLAAAILAPLTPVIIGLAAAIFLIGAACALVGIGINNFADGLVKMKNAGIDMEQIFENIKKSIGKAIGKALEGFGKFITEFGTLAKFMIAQFVEDLEEDANKVWEAAKKMGGDIIDGLVNGVKSTVKWLLKTATGAAKGAVTAIANFLGIASPSKVTTKIGEQFGQGLANGIKNLSGGVSKTSKSLAKSAVDALSTVPEVLDGLSGNFSPVITPVIDLTNVEAGGLAVDELIGKAQSIGVDTSYKGATSITQSMKLSKQAIDPVQQAIDSLKDMFKGTLAEIKLAVPEINFNGTYSFAGQDDIDYFMNQAALLVQRRK